jgi:hypothetical protein
VGEWKIGAPVRLARRWGMAAQCGEARCWDKQKVVDGGTEHQEMNIWMRWKDRKSDGELGMGEP